ncbi:MAG TPA: phosphatase PAP2 family protein [Propionicimonas sp.]|nr:phosphatase PAP2 family protein [Propionicimonas sp.]
MREPAPGAGGATPTVRAALSDAGLRAALPAVGLLALNVALGRALTRRPELTRRETAAINRLRTHRTPALDRAARMVSTAADVPASVVHGVVLVAVLHHRSRQWWRAAVPGLALILETAVYLGSGALVRRPRPDVERLDHDQPTSSFPSGHQGATVALMVVYALLARGVHPVWLRTLIRTGCLAYPTGLAWGRLYTGMHYPSDVAMGTVNGVAAGLLGWHYLRPSRSRGAGAR